MHIDNNSTIPKTTIPLKERSEEKEIDEASNRVSQIGAQTLGATDEKVNSPSLHLRVSPENKFLFRFPESSIFTLNTGKTVDVSGIEINLSRIFLGGIGYGGGTSKVIAQAMQAIGHGENVCNLPYIIEGVIYNDYNKIQMISPENEVVSTSDVMEIIQDVAARGFTHINMPIDLNGHASLVSILFSQKGTATLRFYDSLSPSIMSYNKRYHNNRELIEFVAKLLPHNVCLESEKVEVLHLLDQGGEESSGCAYYSLYTALLLKDNADLRNLTSFNDSPLFNESHDKKIRAELVIRTLLAFGTENVIEDRRNERVDGIFSRIGYSELDKLIKKINQLTSE